MAASGPRSTGRSSGVPPERPTESLIREYQQTGNPEVRELLIERHARVIRYLASRFHAPGGTSLEDLVQVANIGLLHAIDRFDAEKGLSFITFATPTITGIIKRYFRDHGWGPKAPRRLRELALKIRRLRRKLEQELGHSPTVQAIAEAAEVSEEMVLQAMDLEHLDRPISLDASHPSSEGEEGASFQEALGAEDPRYSAIDERERMQQALKKLDERMQSIVRMRFYGEASQADVARELGISQMHVSRLERQALRLLRQYLS